MKKVFLSALVLCIGFSLQAQVKLPRIFGDHMVLQRDHAVNVWGWAGGKEKVTVQLNKQTKTVTAGKDGKWKVVFDALPAGGPYNLIVKSKDKKIEFQNILMGDVWLCSGQSNMLFRLNQAYEGKQAIENSTNKKIRLFQLNAIR